MTILKDPPGTLAPCPDEPPRKPAQGRMVQVFTEGRQRVVEISPRSPLKARLVAVSAKMFGR